MDFEVSGLEKWKMREYEKVARSAKTYPLRAFAKSLLYLAKLHLLLWTLMQTISLWGERHVGTKKVKKMMRVFCFSLGYRRIASLDVLLDGSLEGRGVGTNNGSDLLAVLEEHESGHGADAELLGNLGQLVDVNLVETGAGVCGGHPETRQLVNCSQRQ
jgi:hypothetical protein